MQYSSISIHFKTTRSFNQARRLIVSATDKVMLQGAIYCFIILRINICLNNNS